MRRIGVVLVAGAAFWVAGCSGGNPQPTTGSVPSTSASGSSGSHGASSGSVSGSTASSASSASSGSSGSSASSGSASNSSASSSGSTASSNGSGSGSTATSASSGSSGTDSGASTGSVGSTGSSGTTASTGSSSSGSSGGSGSSGSAQVVECGTLPTINTGTVCQRTGPGTSLAVLLQGTVLAPGVIYHGGSVAVDATGTISCVGCGCAAPDQADTVTCPTGVISPGLINTHDHITYTQDNPYTQRNLGDGGFERYEHRHDWREGKNGHHEIPSTGSATNDQQRWGELRFLMGGATSIVGSGAGPNLLRNLDKAADEEGLNQPAVDFDTFPLKDSNGTQLASGCGYDDGGYVTPGSIASQDAYEPHIAEGIRDFATNEFTCLSSATPSHDIILPKTSVIHGVGLTSHQYAEMAANQTKLIWSPRSNVTLYGDTARVVEADHLGVQIALGTDWMPSGSMNLLRELQCADGLNKSYFGHYFSDEQLWRMVTINAAAATHTDDVVGSLAQGKVADISVFDGTVHPDFRAVIDAQPQDVVLVIRGGKVLYGDDDLVLDTGCDQLSVCPETDGGLNKRVCLQSEVGKTYAALHTSAGANIYPAWFCGAPTNEPSCTPQRWQSVNGSNLYVNGPQPGVDTDGDGIPDTYADGGAWDNCPTVFNPIRPMDNGVQPDVDHDGVGDACDVCPNDANTTTCTSFDPNDVDGDGVANAIDDCPSVYNPDQADQDGDGKGDVCDQCPGAANPGSAACPASIYQVKDGTYAEGSNVALSNALVTGTKASFGFFVQVAEYDDGYDGGANSGLFIYDPVASPPAPGARVNVTGQIRNFFGELELQNSVVTTGTGSSTLPAPIVVAAADVATGGALAEVYEGTVVQVQDVGATDVNPPKDSSDTDPTNEFAVDDGLRIDDLFYLTSPFPSLGEQFTSITGVLAFRNNNSKIEPRSSADEVLGSPILVGFSPATRNFVYEGALTTTTPSPLTVTLSNASASDTLVYVSSSDPTSLAVADGGGYVIPAGQTSVPIVVEGFMPTSADVTLTAQVGTGSPLTAGVRVLDGTEPVVLQSLSASTTTLAPGASTTITASLNIPAPTGGAQVTVDMAPDAGTLSADPILVAAGQLDGTASYTDFSAQNVTLTGSFDGGSAAVSLTISRYQDLFFSEYTENTGNNKALEIANLTSGAIDLSNYKISEFANGATSASASLTLSGSLASGHVFVVCNQNAANTTLAAACTLKTTSSALVFNGDDAIELVKISTGAVVDSIGQVGHDPGDHWAGADGGATTLNDDLRRVCNSAPDTTPTDAYDPTVDFVGFGSDYSDFGHYSCP